ncbi:MAG: S1/P1 Nuclease [Bacteroidetes bacterium]|nr:MAG: S1/P1 Nuclease [Bacteroidota bacterium]
MNKMKTKKWVCLLLFFLFAANIFALPKPKWGQTGHRVIGQIAENHLSKKTKRKINEILGNESLAMASNWADFIKSDTAYNYVNSWHYVNITAGKTYEESEKNPQGDAIEAIERLSKGLKSGNLTKEQKMFHLRILVHLVGDIHQPFHAGRKEDKGGNDIKVSWFKKPTNIHSVWDTELVEYQQLSYMEFVAAIDFANKSQIENWQKTGVKTWVEESRLLAEKLYAGVQKDENLSYRYDYQHNALLKEQLLKGGIRLAGLLNEIFE